MLTNNGGICLFHKSAISACEVPLPAFKSGLEVLAVYLHAARQTALVVVFYRPGSHAVSTAFFDDFDEVLEGISTFAGPVMLMGDLNLHLDIETDPNTVKFNTTIENHGLQQHVASCTYRAGHLLDVFITRSDCPVHAVDIAPPELSDHSFIKVTVDLQFQYGSVLYSSTSMVYFDFDGFCDDLSSSALLCDPPADAVELFTSYHNTMQVLVSKYAPFAVVKHRAHSTHHGTISSVIQRSLR